MVWRVHAYSSNYSGNEGVGLFELKVLRPALQDPISKEEIKKGMEKRKREGERDVASQCTIGNMGTHCVMITTGKSLTLPSYPQSLFVCEHREGCPKPDLISNVKWAG